MTDSSRIAMTALEFRKAFDQVYAMPPPSLDSEHTESLLAIRLAGNPYAIRVSQVSGLVNDRKIMVLPSSVPELLGVAGIRGGLVPVYSLAALLGHNHAVTHARWVALCGAEDPVGLAFSDFEGYLKIASNQILTADHNHSIREHVQQAVHAAGLVHGIVNIPSVVETIKKRCGHGRISQER